MAEAKVTNMETKQHHVAPEEMNRELSIPSGVFLYLILKKYEKNPTSWALVAHVCNPNSSGDRSGGSRFESQPR
jgi:hypothetical protein